MRFTPGCLTLPRGRAAAGVQRVGPLPPHTQVPCPCPMIPCTPRPPGVMNECRARSNLRAVPGAAPNNQTTSKQRSCSFSPQLELSAVTARRPLPAGFFSPVASLALSCHLGHSVASQTKLLMLTSGLLQMRCPTRLFSDSLTVRASPHALPAHPSRPAQPSPASLLPSPASFPSCA